MILTMASSNTEQIPINKLITAKKLPPSRLSHLLYVKVCLVETEEHLLNMVFV